MFHRCALFSSLDSKDRPLKNDAVEGGAIHVVQVLKGVLSGQAKITNIGVSQHPSALELLKVLFCDNF